MTKSEKFWNRTAIQYDQEEKQEEKNNDSYIERLSTNLKPDDSVLDFGCGTGLISIGISGKVKKIKAIDTSSELIKLAKENGIERNIENIEFIHSDIFSFGKQGQAYDVILALYIFHLIEDLNPILKIMHEILKPAGRLLIAMPCMGDKDTLLSVILGLLSKIDIVPPTKAYKISQIIDLLRVNGFDAEKTELIDKNGQQYFIAAKKSVH